MKSLKLTLFSVLLACVLLGCKKGGDDSDPDCMNDNTTTVTFANTGNVPLRLKVATRLTPQMEPVDPVVTLDLAPGALVVKEIQADRYNLVWYANCATSCTIYTNYAKTYEQCSEYTEEQGF